MKRAIAAVGLLCAMGAGIGSGRVLIVCGAGQRAPDGDADGLPDAWECIWFAPDDGAASEDPDGDGQDNLQEYAAGTNPWMADSDGDGLPDGAEPGDGDPCLPEIDDADGVACLLVYRPLA